MTAPDTGSHPDGAGKVVDLRLVPLTTIRGGDLRSLERDLWADERAIWDRMTSTWAGLDDVVWHLPGAAPSDSDGPPWSLAEHVGHIADWQEMAVDYTGRAIETGEWPSDSDYDDGNFDTYNERRREPWASMPRDAILDRLTSARARLLDVARRLTGETIRLDEPWTWVYMTLHGHYLDHLAVIEPWTRELRRRQVGGDASVADPRAEDHAGVTTQDAATDRPAEAR